jgi:hypothetical protein
MRARQFKVTLKPALPLVEPQGFTTRRMASDRLCTLEPMRKETDIDALGTSENGDIRIEERPVSSLLDLAMRDGRDPRRHRAKR